MKPSSHPLRIGLFVLAGLALLVAAVVVVGGARVFAATERGVLHFRGSVVGLQVGAPVVLAGVRVGSVVSIGVTLDEQRGALVAPVVVSLDRSSLLQSLRAGASGAPVGGGASPAAESGQGAALAALVRRGLQGDLAVQSLLTGQQYVDLSIDPSRLAGATLATGAASPSSVGEPGALTRAEGLVVIPTRPPAPSLQSQLSALAALDLRALVADLSAIASAARQFVGAAELKQGLADLSRLAANLARLSATLEQRVGPLAQGAQSTIDESRQAAAALNRAAERVGSMAEGVNRTAEKLGRASDRAEALLAPEAPLARSLHQAAEQVAASAQALRQATAEDAPALQSLEATLAELRRTARAVRSLAETIEREPESLLRGRRP